MATMGLRRSERLGTYDSNGRDYLSSIIGWTRAKFEEWLHSDTVRPHVRQWYLDCISDSDRFNDGIEWINTGSTGYFYEEHDLEKDLLLMCLNAGSDGLHANCGDATAIDFAAPDVDTEGWITPELWARTAWRIVNDNCSQGQVFEQAIVDRPAFAYGFVGEILCVAFHSIAHRGVDSVYLALVKDAQTDGRKTHVEATTLPVNALAPKYDDNDEYTDTITSNSGDADRLSDVTFTDATENRSDSELSTIIIPANIPNAAHASMSDIGSNIQVSPRKLSNSTKTTPKTAGKSSMGGVSMREPLTPDTSSSTRAVVVWDEGEPEKHEWVREWLAKTSNGQEKAIHTP